MGLVDVDYMDRPRIEHWAPSSGARRARFELVSVPRWMIDHRFSKASSKVFSNTSEENRKRKNNYVPRRMVQNGRNERQNHGRSCY